MTPMVLLYLFSNWAFHVVQSCADHMCIQKYIMNSIVATAPPHTVDVPLSNFLCVAPSLQENHVKYQSFDHTSLG